MLQFPVASAAWHIERKVTASARSAEQLAISANADVRFGVLISLVQKRQDTGDRNETRLSMRMKIEEAR